jgi:hypothetical protein
LNSNYSEIMNNLLRSVEPNAYMVTPRLAQRRREEEWRWQRAAASSPEGVGRVEEAVGYRGAGHFQPRRHLQHERHHAGPHHHRQPQ